MLKQWLRTGVTFVMDIAVANAAECNQVGEVICRNIISIKSFVWHDVVNGYDALFALLAPSAAHLTLEIITLQCLEFLLFPIQATLFWTTNRPVLLPRYPLTPLAAEAFARMMFAERRWLEMFAADRTDEILELARLVAAFGRAIVLAGQDNRFETLAKYVSAVCADLQSFRLGRVRLACIAAIRATGDIRRFASAPKLFAAGGADLDHLKYFLAGFAAEDVDGAAKLAVRAVHEAALVHTIIISRKGIAHS